MTSPAGQNLSLLKKLFAEMQKEKYSFLYDLSKKEYKNNKLKQIAWGEVADAMEMPRDEVQVLWKRTKNKYKNALASANAPSGSSRRKPNQMETFLLEEMEFLRQYVEDEEPTTTSYISGNSQQVQKLFDEMAMDPEVAESSTDDCVAPPKRKRPKSGVLGNEVETALKRLDNLATSILSTPQDPFYAYFQAEMEKFPENVKAELKSAIMQKNFEAQQRHF